MRGGRPRTCKRSRSPVPGRTSRSRRARGSPRGYSRQSPLELLRSSAGEDELAVAENGLQVEALHRESIESGQVAHRLDGAEARIVGRVSAHNEERGGKAELLHRGQRLLGLDLAEV